jgi:hypothetical protein
MVIRLRGVCVGFPDLILDDFLSPDTLFETSEDTL